VVAWRAVADEIEKLIEAAVQALGDRRLPEAKSRCSQAVALCREAKRTGALIRSLKALGQIERDLGNDAAALALYEEAVVLCCSGNDQQVLAHTVRHVGDIHNDLGQWQLAQPCYEEALRLYRGHASTAPLDLANAIRPFAILKEQAGEKEAAEKLWEEARKLYESVGAAAGVAESSRRLAALAK
jgi:tetratricopeptide (TPR) repeat protein